MPISNLLANIIKPLRKDKKKLLHLLSATVLTPLVPWGLPKLYATVFCDQRQRKPTTVAIDNLNATVLILMQWHLKLLPVMATVKNRCHLWQHSKIVANYGNTGKSLPNQYALK